MQSLGIQSSSHSRTQTFGRQEPGGAKQADMKLQGDQVELRSSKEVFEATDDAKLQWDQASMKTTLSMIRKGSGFGIHSNLDPLRVVSLLGEAGLATV